MKMNLEPIVFDGEFLHQVLHHNSPSTSLDISDYIFGHLIICVLLLQSRLARTSHFANIFDMLPSAQCQTIPDVLVFTQCNQGLPDTSESCLISFSRAHQRSKASD